MKIPPTLPLSHPAPPAGGRAFTLTDLLTAVAILSFVTVGVVYSHVFGLKMAMLTNSKLSATHNARQALNRVREEIRSGKMLYVGTGDSALFTHIATASPQIGNALQIYPTMDTNHYVRYYLDLEDQSLKRKDSSKEQVEEVASYITNQMVFRAEDHLGNVLTNDCNHRVIRMTLDFFQWEFPTVRVGGDNYYDFYRLQTRVAPRAIE